MLYRISNLLSNKHSQLLSIAKNFRTAHKMATNTLNDVPLVDIESGLFKYILIKVTSKDGTDSKDIVRGYADCKWHSDIFERVKTSYDALGVELKCLGGGRIHHTPEEKHIKVFGESTGYGQADHSVSRDILKTKYSDYDIEITD